MDGRHIESLEDDSTSRLPPLHDLNRSDRTDHFRDRELLDAVLQKKEEQNRVLNESAGSRLSALILRADGNLSRPSSFVSKRSINLSQDKLSEAPCRPEKEEANVNILERTTFNLALLCISSLLLAALSLKILMALTDHQSVSMRLDLTLIGSNTTFEDVLEVATAMSTFVIILDMTCLLVCSMQCLFVVKILKVPQGEERALKFLKDCSSSRFIAVTGFLVSIPTFLVSLVLYIIMRFRLTPAITACVILCVGILFCILSVMQNTYHWRVEKTRALEGLPVYDISIPKTDVKGRTAKELSTLV
ncbi:hypothetical protein CHS0354_011988 [Potamilus streckersoni]|uniref:Uncharacterized protein n=1 Tax=Potamilus streckersoni TaxID=2493646 RepID=A0AAE0VSV0_9BIVA|nr:hypothetical protein CHS0354_011988 [Potamilus streckersoni]